MNSQPGRGSTFWLSIPYKLPPEDPDSTVPTSVPAALPRETSIGTLATAIRDEHPQIDQDHKPSARILVAEDNVINQKFMNSLLKRLGYTADMVANGREAVDAMQATLYDVVLMDCQMPEMDGYEATVRIRAWEKDGRHVRIIALTADVLTGVRDRCLACGMDDYLAKPIRAGELARKLEECTAVGTVHPTVDLVTDYS